MTYYKTTTQAQLWTQIGNKSKLTTIGAIITLSGKTLVIKDRLCAEISSDNYYGKYIETRYLEVYVPEPPLPPSSDKAVTLAGTFTIIMPDGTILHNVDDIKWE